MYSKGIMWLDECRIPFVDEGDRGSAKPLGKTLKHKGWDTEKWLEETKEPHTQGRFTPNLLVCDDMLNDGSVSKSVKGGKGKPLTNHNGITNRMMRPDTIQERNGFDDKGTNSRYYDLDLWFDKMVKKL